MNAALIVLGLAGADLIGWAVHRGLPGRARFRGSVLGVIGWLVVLAVGGYLLGASPVVIALAVVSAALWAPLTSYQPAAAIAFFAIVAAIPIVEQVAAASPDAAPLSGVAAPGQMESRLVAGVAVALFLGLSANVLCRLALERARRSENGGDLATPDPRLRAVLERRWAVPSRHPGQMRGGRLIGPLERWLIVGLALVGAQGIVAALMAAKGIVRFPEISKNSGEGSKAEEFLIGSLISWGLAGAGALLIATAGGTF